MRRTETLGAALMAAIAVALGASCSQPTDDRKPDPVVVTPPPTEQPTAFTPVPATMRRLLSRQYKNAVRTLFGPEAAAAAAPPEDASVDGFDAIAARKNALSDSAVSAYEKSARAVAAAAMTNKARIEKLTGCTPKSSVDAECHASFVARLGRLAWRRPLSDAEVARYVALAKDTSADTGDFYAGVEATISAFLQSPRFLYMQEVGVPLTGQEVEEVQEGLHGDPRKLTDQELLTRMSFFLLDTTPDETLLDLVAAEGLETEEQIRFVASVMLERLEARAALSGFFAELYRTRELDAQGKDAALYPTFSPSLARSMREGMLRTIEDVVWERDADVREIFTADYTFVNKELAALYGVAAPSGDAFGKVLLPKEEQRDGLLGQPGILARFAHSATTSPTLRGKFVREKLLCQIIPPPPPDVLTKLPDDDPTQAPKTMKEKLSQHQKDPACSGCHKLMDGVGFAFERFDAIGGFRTKDQGIEIDPSTSTDGLGAFSSPTELGAILRTSPEAADCLVRNVYRNALGHLETPGERDELEAISATFAANGYRVRELLVDLVSSRAFRIVGVPE